MAGSLGVTYLGGVSVRVGALSQEGFHDVKAIVLHSQAQRAVTMLQDMQSGHADSVCAKE
jgi:hypothetical protein